MRTERQHKLSEKQAEVLKATHHYIQQGEDGLLIKDINSAILGTLIKLGYIWVCGGMCFRCGKSDRALAEYARLSVKRLMRGRSK